MTWYAALSDAVLQTHTLDISRSVPDKQLMSAWPFDPSSCIQVELSFATRASVFVTRWAHHAQPYCNLVLQTILTMNMVSAAQWYEGFEAEFGNVEGIQAQPITFQGQQAQPLVSQGHMAQPLEHQPQSIHNQPRSIQAQPWGFRLQPFAAAQQPLSIDTWRSQHATVSTVITESILQPDTPDQHEAGLTKNTFGDAHTLPGKAPDLSE